MFYIEENGRRSDAALHESILGDDKPSEALLRDTYERARRAGLSEETIAQLYGVPKASG